MTDEDKLIVAGYMGWRQYKYPPYYLDKNGNIEKHSFDLNDASLVVQEMQKQEDYLDFILVAYRQYDPTAPIMGEDILFFAWLMTMEDGQALNFFKAFVEWRKK